MVVFRFAGAVVTLRYLAFQVRGTSDHKHMTF